jgi:hypothetical protein
VSQYRPRASQNFFCFGNPAIPDGPVAFRPTIARGLAFSVLFFNVYDVKSNFNAKRAWQVKPAVLKGFIENS